MFVQHQHAQLGTAAANAAAAGSHRNDVDDICMHHIASTAAAAAASSEHQQLATAAAAAAAGQQDADIFEYDEDNVVVIDLTEERNSSSKLHRDNCLHHREDGRGNQKTGPLALHEVRYENYVNSETNETIEIKRQVYYDDSDLISPEEDRLLQPEQDLQHPHQAPPNQWQLETNDKNNGEMEPAPRSQLIMRDKSCEVDLIEQIPEQNNGHQNGDQNNGFGVVVEDDIVAPPSQFSTSSNLSDTSDDNTQIAQEASNLFNEEGLDRLFNQSRATSQIPDAAGPLTPPPEDDVKVERQTHRGSTILNESELTWLNYQRYCQEEAKGPQEVISTTAEALTEEEEEEEEETSEEESSSSPKKPAAAAAAAILPPVVRTGAYRNSANQDQISTNSIYSKHNESTAQQENSESHHTTKNNQQQMSVTNHKETSAAAASGVQHSPGRPKLPSLTSAASLVQSSSDSPIKFQPHDVRPDYVKSPPAAVVDSAVRHQLRKQSKSLGRNETRTTGAMMHDELGATSVAPTSTSLPSTRDGRRSASCRRGTIERPKTSAALNYVISTSNSVSNTLQRQENLHIKNSVVGRKAKSNDFLDQVERRGRAAPSFSRTMGGTLSQLNLISKMTRIEKNLYLGNLEAATDVILLESNRITHIISVDSVPLPRKMTSMLPRIALLHLQVTDLPDEDLLSYITTANSFIEECRQKGGACLVHCYRGRSRSATVVTAYLMYRHSYSMEKALGKVRAKRPSISPHASFQAQLKLYENMDFTIDPSNIQLKMFRLHCASERMRKAKILFRDSLDIVLDDDPAVHDGVGGHPPPSMMTSSSVFSSLHGGGGGGGGSGSAKNHPMAYKCKRCRRTLATAYNLLPHCVGESPNWLDEKWALPSEEVLEGASDCGMNLCASSLFINPIKWMANEIKAKLSGRLYCPHCQAKVGHYSWVLGRECGGSAGCGATVIPAFQLDVTEIIFRTKNKYLQSTGREPIVV